MREAAGEADDDCPSIKVVIVGDGLIGKTTLLVSYANDGQFLEQHVPTVLDTYTASILVRGVPYTLHIYDTAGQEEYDRLRCLSYPQTDVFLVCYSVVSGSSHQNADEVWIPEVQGESPGTPFILIGLKSDLRHGFTPSSHPHDERVVTYEEGASLARRHGAAGYLECSAKLNQGIKEVFDAAVETFIESREGRARRTRKRRMLRHIRARLRQCTVS